jgi:hypothetical protein
MAISIFDKPIVKKIVVLCQSYQSGNKPPVKDVTACDLPVGSFYPAGTRKMASWGQLVGVTEKNDYFIIQEGEGAMATYQQFQSVRRGFAGRRLPMKRLA